MEEVTKTEPVDVPVKPEGELLKPKRNLTPVFIAIAVVGLALIALFAFLTIRKSGTPTASINSQTENQPAGYEGKLSEATSYVASQRLSSGYYNYYSHMDQLCSGTDPKNCQFVVTDNKKFLTVAWTALAHFSDYKISNKADELTGATNDLYKLIDTCKTQKANCTSVLVQPEIIYKDTKDPKVLQFIKDEADVVATSKLSDDLMIRGIEARELALSYELTKNPVYLASAKNKLQAAQTLLTQKESQDLSPKKKFQRETCWVSLAQIELGRVQGNSQDILNAIYYLDQKKLVENPDSLFNPIVFQPCIESYYLAGYALKSDSYIGTANQLLDKFLSLYYDTKSNKILFGEGGTTTFPRTIDNKQLANSTALPDSAYTSYLLYQKILSTK